MKKFLIITLMSFVSLSVFGQSDEILDLLYEQDDAQTLYTSLIVLQAGGLLDSESNIDDTKMFLESTKWGASILKDGEYITAGGFSLLVMESFDLPHGLMYNFLPIKRYALKELLYQGYILGSPYPNDIMSSFDVVYAISSLPVDENINKDYVDNDDIEEETVIEEVVIEETTVEVTPEEEIVIEETTVEVTPEEVVVEETSTEEVIDDGVIVEVAEEVIAEETVQE